MGKSIEYWFVLAGMVIYTILRDAESAPIKHRIAKTGASALLTIGLSPSISEYTWDSEVIAAVGIMALGLIVLDVATGLVSDQEYVKDIIRNRLGGGKK